MKEELEFAKKRQIQYKDYYPGSEDWRYIRNNKDMIWDFLNTGYKKSGYEKFCGCDNVRSLIKNANKITIAFSEEEIVAISVYAGYKEGYKNVGITATTDEKLRGLGKEAVNRIIKDNVQNYHLHYWCECSGAIEHLYIKNKGVMIPNEYAHEILNMAIEKEPDGFHYKRPIKGEWQNKVIIGFNNYETFSEVYKKFDSYIEKCIEQIEKSCCINEAYSSEEQCAAKEIIKAKKIIDVFADLRMESDIYEFPIEKLDILQRAVSVIKTLSPKTEAMGKRQQEMNIQAVDMGEYLLLSSTTLYCSEFK